MKNKLRLVFALICALAIGTPAQFQRGAWAGGIEPDEPRGALQAQLSASTTDAVQDALKIANRNLKRRSKSAPDAQYVVTLEQSLLRRHETHRGGEALIFTPTTDAALSTSRYTV